MAFHVFGLTGGIGSGKSTVLERFRARGLPVLSADAVARAVVEPGTPALAEIAREFGAEILDADGSLNRKFLAERVFSTPSLREKLEAITHPRIRAEARARFAAFEARGEALACYEVPLLFEVGLEDELRPIVIVTAPEAVQLERAAHRDRADREKIRARMLAQHPLSAKIARADYVIDNAGSLENTFEQADRVLDAICARFGIDAARYPIPPA